MAKKKAYKKKWDTSIIIAIIAVLISTVSTCIGIKESQIMQEQQTISLEQQAASVWPYLENKAINNYVSDTKATYQMIVRNKGVGPAIIDSVHYEHNGKEIKGWDLGSELTKQYPNLLIDQIQNATLDESVLSPGEIHSVVKLEIIKEKSDSIDLYDVLHNLDFHLNYCYCSIYGKCWRITDNKKRNISETCQPRETIN